MILFIIIILIEMLTYAFRGTKKNIIRLICNVGSTIVAGLITLLIFKLYPMKFSNMTSMDLTFGGNLVAKDAETLDGILTAFTKGAIFACVYTVLYLVIKNGSIIVTRILVKDDAPKGFKPLGLAFGFASGLIAAGFTLMPLTGLQQVFPDRATAVKTAEFVSEYAGEGTGKLVKFFAGPYAERMSRYTGIGLITNGIYNGFTTAKTDAGKECLADFVPPYLEKLDEIPVITGEDTLLSEKMKSGGNVLEAFSETELFTEKEKIGILENVVKNNVLDLDELPDYRKISQLSKDVSHGSKIVKTLENSVPADKKKTFPTGLKFEEIDLNDSDIEKIADELYSMDAGSFYVNYLLSMMLKSKADRINEDAFESTKPAFVKLLKTAMKLKNAIVNNTIASYDYTELVNDVSSIRASGLVNNEDYVKIVETIRNNTQSSGIPDYVFDYLLP